MNTANLTKVLSGPAGWALVIAVGAFVAFKLYDKGKEEVGDAVDAVRNVNAGTPYEGFGVVGTLGNMTNQALGGIPESVGGWLGRTFYDLTHDD